MTFTPEQLDMQPPGSILDWRIYDDGFIADDYRIVLTGPQAWDVRRSGKSVGTYRSLRTAFVSAEHDYRESLRLQSLKRHGILFGLSVLAWLAVDIVFGMTGVGLWVLALFPIVYIGMRSLVRGIAALPGNAHNPYASVPYDHRPPRWRRWLRRW